MNPCWVPRHSMVPSKDPCTSNVDCMHAAPMMCTFLAWPALQPLESSLSAEGTGGWLPNGLAKGDSPR